MHINVLRDSVHISAVSDSRKHPCGCWQRQIVRLGMPIISVERFTCSFRGSVRLEACFSSVLHPVVALNASLFQGIWSVCKHLLLGPGCSADRKNSTTERKASKGGGDCSLGGTRRSEGLPHQMPVQRTPPPNGWTHGPLRNRDHRQPDTDAGWGWKSVRIETDVEDGSVWLWGWRFVACNVSISCCILFSNGSARINSAS